MLPETFTEEVNNTVESSGLEAKQRLLLLMQLIDRQGLGRYDIALQNWTGL